MPGNPLWGRMVSVCQRHHASSGRDHLPHLGFRLQDSAECRPTEPRAALPADVARTEAFIMPCHIGPLHCGHVRTEGEAYRFWAATW